MSVQGSRFNVGDWQLENWKQRWEGGWRIEFQVSSSRFQVPGFRLLFTNLKLETWNLKPHQKTPFDGFKIPPHQAALLFPDCAGCA